MTRSYPLSHSFTPLLIPLLLRSPLPLLSSPFLASPYLALFPISPSHHSIVSYTLAPLPTLILLFSLPRSLLPRPVPSLPLPLFSRLCPYSLTARVGVGIWSGNGHRQVDRGRSLSHSPGHSFRLPDGAREGVGSSLRQRRRAQNQAHRRKTGSAQKGGRRNRGLISMTSSFSSSIEIKFWKKKKLDGEMRRMEGREKKNMGTARE